jgi:hypothetical protein
MSTRLQVFQMPYVRVFPGYWICSALFIFVAFSMVGSHGWKYGALPVAFAIGLPVLSYLSRGKYVRRIELDAEAQTITQVFQKFGKAKRTTLNAQQFTAYRLHITVSRFPKASLQLHARDSSAKDVQLVLTDVIAGNGRVTPIDAIPQALLEVASALEKYFSLAKLPS